jgi:hypothetical protein
MADDELRDEAVGLGDRPIPSSQGDGDPGPEHDDDSDEGGGEEDG